MVTVSAMDETFRNERYMYEEHFKTNPDLLGVVGTQRQPDELQGVLRQGHHGGHTLQ